MRDVFKFIYLATFLLGHAYAQTGRIDPSRLRDMQMPESILRAEAIVARFDNLDELLANPQAINDYYQALAEYYGPVRFTRDRFNSVINQLIEVGARLPELKERLWRTDRLGEGFRIVTDALEQNRDEMDIDQWYLYFQNAQREYGQQSSAISTMSSSDRRRYISQTIHRLEAEIQDEMTNTSSLSSRQQRRRMGQLFSRLQSDREFRELQSYILSRYYLNRTVANDLGGQDTALILARLNALGETENGRYQSQWIKNILDLDHIDLEVSDALIGQILQGRITEGRLRAAQVLQRVTIENWDFVPLPRRLHGIFAGIGASECVGGGICADLHPERWSVIALNETQQVHTLRNGRFDGFLQYVPLLVNESEGSFIDVSVDFQSRAIGRSVSFPGRDGNTHQGILYDLWLEQAMARRQESSVYDHITETTSNYKWRQFIYGVNTDAMDNNNGAIDRIRTRSSFIGGDNGNAFLYNHIDHLADEIVGIASDYKDAHNLAGNMITETTYPDVGENKRLRDLLQSQELMLRHAQEDPSLTVRRLAIERLGEYLDDPDVFSFISQKIKSNNISDQMAAIRAFGHRMDRADIRRILMLELRNTDNLQRMLTDRIMKFFRQYEDIQTYMYSLLNNPAYSNLGKELIWSSLVENYMNVSEVQTRVLNEITHGEDIAFKNVIISEIDFRRTPDLIPWFSNYLQRDIGVELRSLVAARLVEYIELPQVRDAFFRIIRSESDELTRTSMLSVLFNKLRKLPINEQIIRNIEQELFLLILQESDHSNRVKIARFLQGNLVHESASISLFYRALEDNPSLISSRLRPEVRRYIGGLFRREEAIQRLPEVLRNSILSELPAPSGCNPRDLRTILRGLRDGRNFLELR